MYDETRELFNINQITLFFIERRMERAYELYHKALSMRYSKILLLIYIVAFGSYLVKSLIKNPVFNLLIMAEMGLIILGGVVFCFMRSKTGDKMYYKSMNMLLASTVFVKIVFDWSSQGYDVSLSAILVILGSSLAIHLKINFIYLFVFHLFFMISYILRYSK